LSWQKTLTKSFKKIPRFICYYHENKIGISNCIYCKLTVNGILKKSILKLSNDFQVYDEWPKPSNLGNKPTVNYHFGLEKSKRIIV